MRTVETRISDAETRLRPLDQPRAPDQKLAEFARRTEIIEVLAALQRAGRRTPPALLVRPEDALQSLRTAMLLGAVVPELRGRAEKLTADLGELVALRKTSPRSGTRLAADRDRMKDDQIRLAALVDERQRQQSAIERDMEAERRPGGDTVPAGRQPAGPDRQDGAGPEKRGESGRGRQPAGRTPPEAKAKTKIRARGVCKDPGRHSPAIAFASAKGLLPMPVNGSQNSAILAVPTARVAWKKAFRWQPGPARRSQPRAMAGLFTLGPSAATDNS